MSWLTELGQALVEGVVTAGRAVVGVTIPVVTRVVEIAHRVVNAVRDGIAKEFRPPPRTERERIERDLEEVNDRIMRLRKRYQKNRSLSEADNRENKRLLERRNDLARELDAIDKVYLAEEIVDDNSQYHDVQIDDDLAHVAQFHVGQITTNKHCPKCGRDMVLQWARKLPVARVRDFRWGCTGYYFTPQCLHMERVTASDLRLFVNLSHAEFAMSPQDLSEATLEEAPGRVRDAMQELISKARKSKTGVERYRCPIHKERLLPRKKREPNGLLDEFLLGCPRWLPDDNGCNFIIKLKSPAQIAAVLDASGAGGVMAVIGG